MFPRLLSSYLLVVVVSLISTECRAAPAEVSPYDAPIARTKTGKVRGYRDKDICVFKGIPYGEDTAGHRFQPSVPPAPWTDVRDAREFGPAAPQGEGNHSAPPPVMSEDCLKLNVWTPAVYDRHARPVLVYFHGGAYNNGSVNDDLYDGAQLCRRGDVVVVTVNHRLNGFGYLYLGQLGGPEYADSGNVGQLDLILALRWVHDNIAEFGGDLACVTIFGQSGGGAKCATLMAMPAAKGLFHRVWTMSGQQLTGRTKEHATETAREVLKNLGVTPDHLDELKTMPMERLMEAMRSVGGNWAPVVDGGALPRDPFSPDASPLSVGIPMVMGNAHDETTSLIGPGDPEAFQLTWETVPGKIAQHVQKFIGELKPAEIVTAYRRLYPDYTPSEVFFAATTAARSWKGFVLESQVRAAQGGSPTYVYYVNWRSPLDGRKWGAPHTIDIPLVFDNIAASPYTAGAPGAKTLAAAMSEALVGFARTGDPNAPGLPPWPSFELHKRPSMIFDFPLRKENDPRGAERELFESVPYIQPGT